MDFFKFTLVIIILLCASSQVENSHQLNQCSLKGLDFQLQQCLNMNEVQGVQSADSFEDCCKTLIQAVQTGYSCLCSLLRSSTPIIGGITLSLQLSNCYISMPSLAHCHEPPPAPPSPPELLPVPPARQTTVQMPPELPPNALLRPWSSRMNDTPPNPSPIKNSTMSSGQPTLNTSTLPEQSMPHYEEKICSHGDRSITVIRPRLLLAAAICAIM